MAYWESVICFLLNQSLEATEYLDALCDEDDTGARYPNPWTGICTALFIYLAKVGTLARQRSLVQKRPLDPTAANIRDHVDISLVKRAGDIEKALLSY